MSENPAKRKCPSFEAENETCMGETNIDLDTFSFTWAINNYSVLCEMPVIKSPTFFGGPKTKHAWKLDLYPKSKNKQEQFGNNFEHLGIYLGLVEYGNWLDGWKCTPIKTHFQISILNADGQPGINLFETKTTHEFTKLNSSWGNPKVIPSATLVDPVRRLVVDDTLKIRCQIWIHGEMKERVGFLKGRPSDSQRMKTSRDSLVNDFGKMLTQSVASDVTISTCLASFKVHKAVLAARSIVFADMFKANMMEEENETEILQLDHFTNEAVKGMLEYIYTGKTEAVATRAQELLRIATEYCLEGLKEECEYAVADKLCVENAAEMLVLAHTFSAPILKSLTISFINSNKEELSKMKSFQVAVDANRYLGLFADVFLASK